MNIWDPFHPVAYFLHTLLGTAGILGAIAALSVIKGSSLHVLAGRIFAVAATIVAATAVVFSFTSFAPMAVASAVMTISVIGSSLLALRSKNQQVAAGEFVTTALMAFVLLWLLYGVAISVPLGGLLWIPPLIFAALSATLLINDIRFMKRGADTRATTRLPRHFSRMALAFAIAVHEPIVIFADDLNLHPSLAFYGPLVIWPIVFFFFNARIKKGLVKVENG